MPSIFKRIDDLPRKRHYRASSPYRRNPASWVFVRGLRNEVSQERLIKLFTDEGLTVAKVKVDRAPLTTALVGFTKPEAAAQALEKLNGSNVLGVRLMIWHEEEKSDNRQAEERLEMQEMKRELQSLQKLASLAPKGSVFDRVD